MQQRNRAYPLLFWQIALLFAALGTLVPICGQLSALPVALLSLACLLKTPSDLKAKSLIIPFCFYLASFGLGFFAANSSLQPAPPLPAWADKKDPQQITARVEQVEGMPEGRLRIILSDVALNKTEETLPAKLAWTWMLAPPEAPLPGEIIKTELRIREVHGMNNPGSFNIEEYWLEKGVAFRSWTRGEKGWFESVEDPPFWQVARNWLEQRLLQNLMPEDARPGQSETTISGGKAIIPALLMGNKYYLTNQELDMFAAASLSHSLALSGLHLGLMAALGTALAFTACRLFPKIMLTIPRPKLAVLCAAPLVLVYLWLGGITPSLLRAALMFACWGVLLLRGKPHVLLDGLLWALLIMLLMNPLALHDIRLQLSATCIAAIGITLPYSLRIAACLFPGKSRFKHFMRGGVSLLVVSTAIQVVLLPLQAWSFGQATPCFILNLIWLPVLSTVVFPLSVLGLALTAIPGLEGFAIFVFDLAAMPGDWLFSLLNRLDEAGLLHAPAVVRPAGAASIAYWLLLLVMVVTGAILLKTKTQDHPKSKVRGLPAPGVAARIKTVWSGVLFRHSPLPAFPLPLLILLALGWATTGFYLLERWQSEHPAGPRMVMLDVGQGQSILFEGTQGQRILVDGGGLWGSNFDIGKNVLAPSLTVNRAPRLDAVINTHPDRDHIDGLGFILKRFKVKKLYLGQGLPEGEYGDELGEMLVKNGYAPDLAAPPIRAGDTIKLDALSKLRVLHPKREYTGPSQSEIKITKTNNASIVVQLVGSGKNLAITCGDIDQSGIKALMQAASEMEEINLNAQILVLPHHGSKHGFNLDFYDAVDPETALASAGYKNQWGFPVQIIRDEMEKRDIPLYTTADYGQIIVEWDKEYNPKLSFARPE